MDKKKLHHYVRTVQAVKTWQLFVILFFMLFISATFLRLNNLGMVERRQAVIEADKSGDSAKTLEALQELRNYVNRHMNTDMGNGVYLERSYAAQRDAAIERAASADSSNPNSEAYQQASVECQSRFAGGTDSFRNDYVQCVIDRVGALSQAEDPTAGINLPKAEAYRHTFVSPVLSIDAAGFSVFLTLLIALVIAIRLVFLGISRALLRRHYKSIYS